MATQTQGPRKTFKAASDLSTKQYFIVKLTGENTVDLATSPTTEILIGTLNNTPKAGEGADISLLSGGGTALVKAGGNINRGDMLTSDANGKAVATTTVGNRIIGMALNAGANNDVIEYMPVGHVRYAATS